MIENRFTITLEGLKETSKRVIRETPRFRKVAVGMPLAIVILMVVLYFVQTEIPWFILILVGGALIVYSLNLMRKTPDKMAENIFSDMQRKYGEPINHTRMTEGGILILDQDEEGENDRMFPFSTVRLVFATEHFIVAMTTNNRAVLFRKDSFLSGSASQLLAMFRQHCPTAKFDKSIG